MLLAMAVLMGLWFFISFLAGLAITFVGSPKWLELPWSAFGDFAETTDGRVYVELGFYSRILCYDKDGKFIANFGYPGNAKDTKLASSKTGLLFFRTQNRVYGYDHNWETKFVAKDDPAKTRTWKLSEDSKPVLVNTILGAVPDRAVGPGEPLFSPSQARIRESFVCDDGSVLERVGDAIWRTSKDGRVLTRYHSPWWFYLFKFPWPSLLSIPLCVLFAALAIYVKRKGGN